ncbi:MAG: hypothetical protein JRE28_09680 [Deltaproteobacteria bacterium]|nr:hypothetical protein [Deltaproteobacteria bacterium]
MAYWGYPRYVSVVEKRAKAAKKLKQLKKKNPAIKPIIIEGRTIARTWWGKSWNNNLERYADYRNRIGRGRSYVRHGAVLDLQISLGQVESLVQGTRSKPYTVIINIKGIKKKIWQNMKAACVGKLDSLPELLAGKFPKALGEIFTTQGQGLFPSPEEIEFNCSCPDWAYMCKHVAATLYGIGARLDNSPSLFFKLRKAKIDDLIQQTITDQSYNLLKKAEKTSTKMIAESDLSGMFGIDMEDHIDFNLPKSGKKVSSRRKTSRKVTKPAKTKLGKSKPELKTDLKKKAGLTSSEKTGLKKNAKSTSAKTRTKKPGQKSPAKSKTARLTDTAQLLNIIKRSRKGIDVAALKQKTGFDEKKIRNMIYKAHKEGIIRRAGRGIYLRTKHR